jgi:type I site-specific restriction endonuclease
MESKDKKELSEIDICDLFITPAIKQAGWDFMKQVRREVTLVPGPVIEPAVIYEPDDDDDPVPPDPPSEEDENGGVLEPPDVYKIRVSGVPAKIISEGIEYIGPDGNLITESYRDFTRNKIRSEYASLDEFLNRSRKAPR